MVDAIEPIGDPRSIEDHPAIETIYTFIRNGSVELDDLVIKKQSDLVRVLNEMHPEHKLYPNYITRLKKRIRRNDGGYMIKDGVVCYADGTAVSALPLRDALIWYIQIGIEQAVKQPELIQGRDLLKAVDILVRIDRGFGDSNPFADAWTTYAKEGGKKKSVPTQRVVKVIEARGTASDDMPTVDFDENGNVVGAQYRPLSRDADEESLLALRAKNDDE